MTEEPLHDIGHNQPPTPAQLAVEEARAELDPLKERRDQFAKTMDAVKVTSRETAGAAADVLGLARGFLDQIGEKREMLIAPRQEGIRAIHATVENFISVLKEKAGSPRLAAGDPANAGTVWGKIHDFQKAAADLADAQRREQDAAEARLRARHAPEPAPEPEPAHQPADDPVVPAGRAVRIYADGAGADDAVPRSAPGVHVGSVEPSTTIRGDYGFTLGKRKSLAITVTDVTKVPSQYLDNDKVKAAIVSVTRSLIQSGMSIPGISSTETKVSQVQ